MKRLNKRKCNIASNTLLWLTTALLIVITATLISGEMIKSGLFLNNGLNEKTIIAAAIVSLPLFASSHVINKH